MADSSAAANDEHASAAPGLVLPADRGDDQRSEHCTCAMPTGPQGHCECGYADASAASLGNQTDS